MIAFAAHPCAFGNALCGVCAVGAAAAAAEWVARPRTAAAGDAAKRVHAVPERRTVSCHAADALVAVRRRRQKLT